MQALRRARDQGLSGAAYMWGRLHDPRVASPSVVSRKVDDREAFKWYLKAAEEGHPGMEMFLGLSYEYGLAVSKNEGWAESRYRNAAEQGGDSAAAALQRLRVLQDR